MGSIWRFASARLAPRLEHVLGTLGVSESGSASTSLSSIRIPVPRNTFDPAAVDANVPQHSIVERLQLRDHSPHLPLAANPRA
jgi:hypothetical protein